MSLSRSPSRLIPDSSTAFSRLDAQSWVHSSEPPTPMRVPRMATMTRRLAFEGWRSEALTVLCKLVVFGPPWWLPGSYSEKPQPTPCWHSTSRQPLAGRSLDKLEEPSLHDPSAPSSSPWVRSRGGISRGGHSVDGLRAHVWSRTVVDSPDTVRDSHRQTLHPLIVRCFRGPQGQRPRNSHW